MDASADRAPRGSRRDLAGLARTRWWELTLVLLLAVGLLVSLPAIGNRFSNVLTRPTDVIAAVVILGVLLAALLTSRRAPAVALGLCWVLGLTHLLLVQGMLSVEILLVAVAFACARWGSRTVLVLSGLSIPLAVVGFGAYMILVPGALMVAEGSGVFLVGAELLTPRGPGAVPLGPVLTVVGVMLPLLAPWVLGLVVRLSTRATSAERDRDEATADAGRAQVAADQAAEVARLQESRARLARDVHDVVGHSLAVVLAQAQAGQYVDDPERLRETLATIAETARGSLQEVRAVLREDAPAIDAAPDGGLPDDRLATLLAGVRAGGHEVALHEEGRPQPLPPELAEVAHRVLQEMLTNAVRHGRPGTPIDVERHWDADQGVDGRGELRIEVRNEARADTPATDTTDDTRPLAAAGAVPESPGSSGQGLAGMRARLESVGGRLDVRRRAARGEAGTVTFTVTAWLPVRDRRAG